MRAEDDRAEEGTQIASISHSVNTFLGATGRSNVVTGRATASTATTLTDAQANFLTSDDKLNGLNLTMELRTARGLTESGTLDEVQMLYGRLEQAAQKMSEAIYAQAGSTDTDDA